jgi:hemoglobin
MYDFWSAVVLRTARYAGRPFEAHAGLPELSPAHFERWLALWEATVERVIPPAARAGFTVAAGRMAASMTSRLFVDDRN